MANLDDIPEEVLLDIVEYVYPNKADASNDLTSLRLYDKTKDIADLKSLRLTSRKFSRLATRPLFAAVSCTILDAESLERLENVSQHSHISGIIKTVHLKLGFYDPILAEDPAGLAKYLLWAWEDYQEPAPGDTAAWEAVPTTEEIAMRHTMEEWVYLSRYANRRDRERHLPVLHAILDEYRRRYTEQQNLRKNGDAIHRVGEAMARMPATSLVLQDSRQAHSHLGPLLLSTLKANADPAKLALPLSWTDCARLKEERRLREFTPPFDLLIDIPVSLHRANVTLTELRILGLQIPDELRAWDSIDPYGWDRHPSGLAPLDLTNEIQLATAEDLAEACSDLQVLQFDPQTKRVKDIVQFFMHHFRDRLSRFSQIIGQMCKTQNLRKLHIDCRCVDYGSDPDPNTHYHEAIFKSAFWPNLESLHIKNGRLESADTLVNLIQNLPNLSNLQLDTCGLDYFHIDGTPDTRWTYFLEQLKKEVHRLRKNGLKQRDVYTVDELRRRVGFSFNVELGGFTEVDNYLRGVTDVNPVVAVFERLNLIAFFESLNLA
ncbi:uncharacterized protein PgNI_02353 [Pyricularia grisea]|uniref:Uncharacterized protein n=1 Tax=Pyricularia grisea TaxID=148305 RepID=A0A6P8BID0_PYRGI|nr:uncharacterized protein PgNI_02353 [Pyricularia grisea]TLD16641.1 hypothetical protein PgNI_02353 [Pyricularia grisea]